MIKKAALFFMFIVFIVTVSGCETAKGAVKALKNADEWVQKNLW